MVTPKAEGDPYLCPCCGFLTLDERGCFESCSVCFWEDDGQDDDPAGHPLSWGFPKSRGHWSAPPPESQVQFGPGCSALSQKANTAKDKIVEAAAACPQLTNWSRWWSGRG